MNGYVFRQSELHEVEAVFRLIMSRVRWMDEKGIRQWNVTKYDECYPLEYYEAARRRGDLFVLADEAGGIAACAVLKKEDDRWPAEQQKERAFYLHHFAARLGDRGAGSRFLELAEEYARRCGVRLFRLDSADDNPRLTAYYDQRGYVPAGHCVDGLYTGILREKVLTGETANSLPGGSDHPSGTGADPVLSLSASHGQQDRRPGADPSPAE